MAGGWARDGAVQDQIDDTVSDAVAEARSRMPKGESAEYCDECGELTEEVYTGKDGGFYCDECINKLGYEGDD